MCASMHDIVSTKMLAVSGSNVYVVWNDETSDNNEILFRMSTDGGATFGSTTNLSTNSGNSRSTEIAVSEGNVHVVWSDSIGVNNEILYRVSSDGGATFSSATNLSNNSSFSQLPAIAVSENSM